jgi:ABC-type bacteriocin/lantibiotic exporter with double-glycine peptidase domain
MKRAIKSLMERGIGPLSFVWKLRGEARRYRGRLIAIGLLGAAGYAQSLVAPQITRQIIDTAYPNRDFRLFYILSAVMVGLNVLSSGLQVFSGYISTYVQNMISFRVRMRVLHALYRVPVSYVENQQSGMFLERIASDADRAAGSVAGVLPQLISLVMITILTIGMMANISMLVTVLVMVMVPFYYVTSSILSIKLRKWQQRSRLKDEQLTTRATEAIQGVPTARLFGVGQWLKSMYAKLLRDRIKLVFGMWRERLIWGQLSWAVSYGWGVVLTVGGWYLVFQDRLTLGDAVALGMYIPLLLRPAEQALGIYQSLMDASVPAQRVLEVLETAQNGQPEKSITECRITKGIQLKDITFAYPGSSWRLNKIGLDISCGDSLVVVGSTGSGKTTLLRLMAGMFNTYQGDILADGHSLATIQLSAYQSNVAMVMTDNFFFSGSIMDNMRIAGPHVDEPEVRRMADILGIDAWLSSLPQGYHTPLGAGGIRLSSGQLQKIAVLRALLKKPALLLLDEITSAMDVESERGILDGMQILRVPETMTVLTTHRLTLTKEPWVNRVVVLRNGGIVEEGHPHSLYARGGEYARLMNLAGLGELVDTR